MMKTSKHKAYLWLSLVSVLIILAAIFFIANRNQKNTSNSFSSGIFEKTLIPIAQVQQIEVPEQELIVENQLQSQERYQQFIASYESQPGKQYGLLTIPRIQENTKKLPAVLFIHGLVRPESYRSENSYNGSQAGLADRGFITFKPDLRGHGMSAGNPDGALFSSGYLIDTLYAIQALSQHPQVDSDRIGILGHSNGGATALRALIISDQIQAGVIWSGTVGSYPSILEEHFDKMQFLARFADPVISQHGLPSRNQSFWELVDPYSYLETISAPIQLHHGVSDPMVPVELSRELHQALQAAKKQVELFEYQDAGHNFRGDDFDTAIQLTADLFNQM